MGDIDRNITHDGNAALTAILPQRMPLAEEQELPEFDVERFRFQAFLPGSQRLRFTACQTVIPGVPGIAAMRILNGPEQGVVVKPRGVFYTETVIFLLQVRCGAIVETVAGTAHRLFFKCRCRVVVDGGFTENAGGFQLAAVKKVVRHKRGKIDQQRVAGKGRVGLVRRMGVAGRAQRQYLPDALPGRVQKISKAARFRAQVADPMRGRQ